VVADYAPLASPILTGTPQAPTPSAADNTTKIATTAFVQGLLSGLAPAASPAFTGNPTAPTQSPGDNDTSLATTAFVQSALSGVASGAGNCRLTLSGANLLLTQYNGKALFINGAVQAIPDAGVSLAPTLLTAFTFYYIYAWMNGATMTLEASTTAHQVQAGTGVRIKIGDPTRTLVGAAYVDSGPAFRDQDGKRYVISWFNRRRKTSRTNFTAGRSITPGTLSWLEVHSEIRNSFVSWAEEEVVWATIGSVTMGGIGTLFTTVGFDGTSPEAEIVICPLFSSGFGVPINGCAVKAPLSTEATLHFATLLGSNNQGASMTYANAFGDTSARTELIVTING
jgi:hypothetical protein